ncbi:MAG: PilT/PilU family type 4a pilus ATPase [Alphaproteobacteria bacterium]|nr:PilT/PilU family type 4a pilus ATPase [Alphaproteobacteria bacterium]
MSASTKRLDRFLKLMKDRGASDLHFSVGRPPIFRLSGRTDPVRYRVLTDTDFIELMKPATPPHLWKQFEETGDADYAYELTGVARFRVNLFKQQRGLGAVLRIIPTKILTLDQLNMPKPVHSIVKMTGGLVLVTGPTGSGKSTTLAAIIDAMNKTRPLHFVTIEDPIEFVHDNHKSLVSQREVGPHARNFTDALMAAVREDPDVILVGEMRDLETISMALAAAETGVLVFGTLHTNSASKTVDRVINVFPTERQGTVRAVLATVLQCVISQQLLRRKKGGRVAALEIMFGSGALASLIREGKTHQIGGYVSAGRARGMITMDGSLRKLVEDDAIESRAALEKALDKDEMRSWLVERGEDVPEDVGDSH